MQPGDREQALTVDRVVDRGADAVDPHGNVDGVTALVEAFEDDIRPATAVDDLAEVLRSSARAIDPDLLQPEVAVAAAAANWLATNPGDAQRPEHAVREGVRLFFGDDAPEPVNAVVERICA